MLFLVLFLTCLILGFVMLLKEKRNRIRKYGEPLPGPRSLPLIGRVYNASITDFVETLSTWARQYGHIFSVNMFGTNVVALNDAETVRLAFTGSCYGNMINDRPSSFIGKYVFYHYSELSASNMTPLQIRLKKILIKTIRVFGDGFEKFDQIAHKERERLLTVLSSYEGRNVNLSDPIGNSLANMLSILLTDENPRTGDAELIWAFNDAVNSLLDPTLEAVMIFFPSLRLLPFGYGRRYRNAIMLREKLLDRYYEGYKASFVPGRQCRGLVDALLQTQEEENKTYPECPISDDHIRCLIINVIFASLSTTRNSLMYLIAILLNNEKCQRKIQSEVEEVVGKDRLPGIEDKQCMAYTEACIIESLRYATPVPTGLVHVNPEDMQFQQYHIPRRSWVIVNLWHLDHDDTVWGDPWVYRPERFLNQNNRLLPSQHRLRQNLLTFSTGRRNCPGHVMAKSRMFLYLTTIVQHYHIKPPIGEPLADPDPRNNKTGTFLLSPPKFSCRLVRKE